MKPPAQRLAIIVQHRRFQIENFSVDYQAMRVSVRQIARVAAPIKHRDRRIETAADSMSIDAVSEMRSIPEGLSRWAQGSNFSDQFVGQNIISIQRQHPFSRQCRFSQRKIPLRRMTLKFMLDNARLGKALDDLQSFIITETIDHDDLARPAQLL